jgi:hypothetical protein
LHRSPDWIQLSGQHVLPVVDHDNSNWTLKNEGQTQVDAAADPGQPDLEQPIDVQYEFEGTQDWPKITSEVSVQDWLGRSALAGYGFALLPMSPGGYDIAVTLWKPVASCVQALTASSPAKPRARAQPDVAVVAHSGDIGERPQAELRRHRALPAHSRFVVNSCLIHRYNHCRSVKQPDCQRSEHRLLKKGECKSSHGTEKPRISMRGRPAAIEMTPISSNYNPEPIRLCMFLFGYATARLGDHHPILSKGNLTVARETNNHTPSVTIIAAETA